MRLIVLICLLLIALSSGVVVADPSVENGDVTIENGTVEIDAWSDDAYLVLDDSVHYTENESWNQTYTSIGSEHRMYFVGAEVGDNATWRDTGVSISSPSFASGSVRVRVVNDSSNQTTFDLEGHDDAHLDFESSEYNDLRVGEDVERITVRDIEGPGPDLSYNATSETVIVVRGIEADTAYIVNTTSGEIFGISSTSDGAEFEVPAGDKNAEIRVGKTRTVGDFEVSPIYREETTFVETERTISYEVTNTGQEVDTLKSSSNTDWISTQADLQIAGGETVTYEISLNGTNQTDEEAYGRVLWGDDGDVVETYVRGERGSDPSADVSEFALPGVGPVPAWMILSVVLTLLVLVTTVFWVRVDPKGDENVWH